MGIRVGTTLATRARRLCMAWSPVTLTLTLMVYSSQQLAIRSLVAHQATLHDPFEPTAQNQALYSKLPVRLHRALEVNMFGLKLGTLTITLTNH